MTIKLLGVYAVSMDNKNSTSVAQNPFEGLSKSAIDTYFVLLETFKALRLVNDLNKDGSFVFTNDEIATCIHRNAVTARNNITKLVKRGLIDVNYTPNRYGEIRKIYVKSLENFNISNL